MNGDGIDDLIIGARRAGPHGGESGESYVVFGKTGSFGASLDLSALSGSGGFVINGIDAGDQSGVSVSSAIDVNGDGSVETISTTSVAGGGFTFEPLFPGAYTLTEIVPSGFQSTTGNNPLTLTVGLGQELAWTAGAAGTLASGQSEIVQPALIFGNESTAADNLLWKFDFNRLADHNLNGGDAVTPGTPCATATFSVGGTGAECWVSTPRTEKFNSSNSNIFFGWNNSPAGSHEKSTVISAGGVPSDLLEVHQDGVLVSNNKVFSVRVPDASATYRVSLLRTGFNTRPIRDVYQSSTINPLTTFDGR